MLKIPPTPFIKGGDKKLPLPRAPRGLAKSAKIGTSRFFSDRLLEPPKNTLRSYPKNTFSPPFLKGAWGDFYSGFHLVELRPPAKGTYFSPFCKGGWGDF